MEWSDSYVVLFCKTNFFRTGMLYLCGLFSIIHWNLNFFYSFSMLYYFVLDIYLFLVIPACLTFFYYLINTHKTKLPFFSFFSFTRAFWYLNLCKLEMSSYEKQDYRTIPYLVEFHIGRSHLCGSLWLFYCCLANFSISVLHCYVLKYGETLI